MQLFYWSARFETGIESVDKQHQHLMELINQLSVAIATERSLPKQTELLQKLHDYSQVHFRDEEHWFKRVNLPPADRQRHYAEHHAFCDRVSQFIAQPLTDPEAAMATWRFLTTWLIAHILEEDMKLGYYLQGGTEAALKRERQNHTQVLSISPAVEVLIQALNESENRFRYLTDCAPVPIWASDQSGVRVYHNQCWTTLLGHPQEKAERDWLQWLHPDDQEEYLGTVSRLLLERVGEQLEVRYLTRNGDVRFMQETIMPRLREDGTFVGLVASSVDITQIKKANQILEAANLRLEDEVNKRTEEIRELMMTDPLTQTGNRRSLNERLTYELSRAQRHGHPLSLIFFDIDHFKQVNDHYGHSVGDQVLTSVAKLITTNLRQRDRLTRFGGEEFVAILPQTQPTEAAAVAAQILDKCRTQPLTQAGVTVTLSAGVGQSQPEDDIDTLLARCDKALYRAKDAGRDRVELTLPQTTT